MLTCCQVLFSLRGGRAGEAPRACDSGFLADSPVQSPALGHLELRRRRVLQREQVSHLQLGLCKYDCLLKQL